MSNIAIVNCDWINLYMYVSWVKHASLLRMPYATNLMSIMCIIKLDTVMSCWIANSKIKDN